MFVVNEYFDVVLRCCSAGLRATSRAALLLLLGALGGRGTQKYTRSVFRVVSCISCYLLHVYEYV